MTAAYPLRLQPIFRDYLWGGRKLETRLGKQLPSQGIWAESWEIVDHPEHSSVITNGTLAGQTLQQVTRTDPEWLLGKSARHAALPLLLKYLDCQADLSVQVHPDDLYAQQMTLPDLGKTEAWYIVAAEPGSVLYAGLKAGVTPDKLTEALNAGSVHECLHEISPQPGDCIFIPAGTVHALGAGLLVAEIQQASNTTFRLFDWNRVGADGRPRELHIAQSLAVIDFASGPRPLQIPQPTSQRGRERLVECDKFVFDRLHAGAASPSRLPIAGDGKLHILTVPVGEVELDCGDAIEHLEAGQSALIPAAMREFQVTLGAETTLLDMSI